MSGLRRVPFQQLRARHIADLPWAGPTEITRHGNVVAYLLTAEQLRQHADAARAGASPVRSADTDVVLFGL